VDWLANTLFAGIDVALKDNRARFVDAEERTFPLKFRFPNDATASVAFVEKTVDLAREHHLEKVRFGLEATSFYAWHLALYPSQAAELAPFDPKVYLFNPRVVRGFKKAYPDLPKTDWADAWAIAERLRFGRLPVPFDPDERYMPLQRLTRHRYHLARDLTRHKNYFLSYLFLRASRMAQESPFSDPTGVTGSAFLLEYRTPDEVAATPIEELTRFLAEKSRGKFRRPDELARHLKTVIKHSYRLPGKLHDADGPHPRLDSADYPAVGAGDPGDRESHRPRDDRP